MRHDARTRAYVQRRTHEGLAKPEIIRCLKRYVAREIYHTLKLATPTKKPEQLLARP
jgi:transposase